MAPRIYMAKEQTQSKKVRIRIKLRAYDSRVMDASCKRIVETALRTGAKVVGPVPLPTKKELFTVIRGPHIDARSREQFVLHTHKRIIDLYNPTSATIDSLSHMSLPAGVGVSIQM